MLRKWLRILPNPLTDEDQTSGYRYELSILQAEFSLTQMLNRPVSGRIFFEQALHDNLDIGRPDQIAWSSTGASSARATTGPQATSAPESSPTV